MRMTREEIEAEFADHFTDLRDALVLEGERVDRGSEWRAFLHTKINARVLRPEAMHWPVPRPGL